MKKDDPLGSATVDLAALEAGKTHDLWVPLEKVKSGQVHLRITLPAVKQGW